MQTIWDSRRGSLLGFLLVALTATAMVAVGTAIATVMLLRDEDGPPASEGAAAVTAPSPTAAPTVDTTSPTPSAVVIVPATPDPTPAARPTERPTDVATVSEGPAPTTSVLAPEPALPTQPTPAATAPVVPTPGQVRFVMCRSNGGGIEGRADGDPGSPTLAEWNQAAELRELFGDAATPLAELWPAWLWIAGHPRCGAS